MGFGSIAAVIDEFWSFGFFLREFLDLVHGFRAVKMVARANQIVEHFVHGEAGAVRRMHE